jgi:hypothetical protein
MAKTKAEVRAKKVSNKTHEFLTEKLNEFIKQNKYEQNGEDLFAVACATTAFAANLLNDATDLEPQEIFAYLSDATAQTLEIELEYMEENVYTDNKDIDNEYPEPTTDKKLLN